ncbi:MAG: prepilin-type N-terminal cleavage/methylation domain-containing protein [Nitrospirae bacterium]|nr:prepilin-type N-terminal cleavage/methylation domain-containing protein [Nitrospirota bacterium]
MRRSGFTLLELMVALFTLTLLVTAAYQGYFGIARGREILESASEMDVQNMVVMHRITRDLQSAYLIRGGTNLIAGPFPRPRTYFRCKDERYGADERDGIAFTALSRDVFPPQSLQPVYDSELAEVAYEVVPDEENSELGVLIRREIAPPGSSASVEEAGGAIARGIVALDFTCYNDQGVPVEDWDSTNLGPNGAVIGHPPLVGIRLTVKSSKGEVQMYITKVFLPLSQAKVLKGS